MPKWALQSLQVQELAGIGKSYVGLCADYTMGTAIVGLEVTAAAWITVKPWKKASAGDMAEEVYSPRALSSLALR